MCQVGDDDGDVDVGDDDGDGDGDGGDDDGEVDVGDDDGDVDDVNVDDDNGDDEHKNYHILIPFHFKVTPETSVVPSVQKATLEVWFNICKR